MTLASYHHRMGRMLAALALAALFVAGCQPSPVDAAKNQADGTYLGDLDARGVPTGITNGAPPELGHAVCTDIGAGSDAGAKLLQVANLQLNHMDQFTTPQAEMIVYWAVKDLCPQYSSQLQDHWKDGS